MSRRKKTFQPKPCAHCGTVFAPKSGVARFCDFQCKAKHHHADRALGLRSATPPVDMAEQQKLAARCKRRLLDGVPMKDLVGVYGQDLLRETMAGLTEAELQQREDSSDDGVSSIGRRIGSTGGDWRSTNTLTKWKGTMGGVFR